jgi:hypothetical protein
MENKYSLNKCAFGYCIKSKDNNFNCEKCAEATKEQGYTGCVYATRKPENII